MSGRRALQSGVEAHGLVHFAGAGGQAVREALEVQHQHARQAVQLHALARPPLLAVVLHFVVCTTHGRSGCTSPSAALWALCCWTAHT